MARMELLVDVEPRVEEGDVVHVTDDLDHALDGEYVIESVSTDGRGLTLRRR